MDLVIGEMTATGRFPIRPHMMSRLEHCLGSLADKKNAQVAWQWFASGLIDDDKFIKEEATIVRRSI
jgi:hypothetical protein